MTSREKWKRMTAGRDIAAAARSVGVSSTPFRDRVWREGGVERAIMSYRDERAGGTRMTISKTKDAVCEEIQRLGNVKVSVSERELLAKAPTEVLHWIRNFADRVFERGYVQGHERGQGKGGRLPETPEEVASRLIGKGASPSLIQLRALVADAIRLDRTERW